MKKYPLIFLLIILIACNQHNQTPLEENNFKHFTESKDLKAFIYDISKKSKHIKIVDSALTIKNNSIYLLNINKYFKVDEKLKVLIFAQQHGNEHSGKEAVLLLLNEIKNNEYPEYLNNLDIYVIPQMNPDGSDNDQRRNGNDTDLNRDHLLVDEIESKFLKNQFHKILPEAILDIHEYNPYSKSWLDFGYIKNFDVQFGTLTNPNISERILTFSKNNFIPFIEKYLTEKEITHNQYIVGGPPNIKRIRYSTTDINDGRQSTGIYNSFSFILEGKNGKVSTDHLEWRSFTQLEAIKGWLKFLNNNVNEIKDIVNNSREELLRLNQDSVILRQEHFGSTAKKLTLNSIRSGEDTLIYLDKFHNNVYPILKVAAPKAYLVDKQEVNLVNWLNKHYINFNNYSYNNDDKITQYKIISIKNSLDEELNNKYPIVQKIEVNNLDFEDYYYVPTKQLARNLIILALEPQSMFGLVQYEEFSKLLLSREFPILRIEY